MYKLFSHENIVSSTETKKFAPEPKIKIKHVQTRTYLDVFHQFLWTVLTVQHSQVREDARVSIVQTETLGEGVGVRGRELVSVCERESE